MKWFAGAVAVVTASCGILFSTQPAYATFPGRNGRIAFVATNRGTSTVKTLRRDGSDLQRVAGNAADPNWSPDGSKIAFTGFHEGASLGCSIEISNPDGTGVVDLGGAHHGCDFGPAFTPAGHRIVFIHDNAMGRQVIMSVNVHGGNRTPIRVVPAGLEAHPPTISPDGKTIALQMSKSDVKRAVFALRMNGTSLRQLTSLNLNVGTVVDWSPDGRRIVFTSTKNLGPGNTMLIRPDGTHLIQITHYTHDLGAGGASYSPNGRWIVYRRQNSATGNYAIWKMRPDGSHRMHVRSFALTFGGLDWGPQPTEQTP